MKFSVVIPLYNKKPYIARCVQSVFRQTYTDFELLIVDDGSTDGGERELDNLSEQRLRYIKQVNQGVSVARNTGLAAALHDIVFFLDGDDTWEPTFLEEMMNLVNLYPDADVFACVTRKIFADGHFEEFTLNPSVFEGNTSILRDYFQTFVDLGQSPFSNSSFGVRVDVFRRAGKYTPNVRLTEDSDLWVRLAMISQIAIISRPLANYFVETENNTRIQAQISDYEVIKTLTRVLKEDAVPPRLRRGAERLLALQKISQIKRLILLGQPAAAMSRLLDKGIWSNRPMESIVLTLATSLPRLLFRLLRNK